MNLKRGPFPPGFWAIWSTVAIDLVGFGIVLPILPIYARRFHTTSFEATMLVAAFSAASFVCSPLWGRVSDRYGRKPVLLVSLAGTAAGSLLTGLAGGFALLLVGRIVDGASGASVSVAQAAAADLSTPADRTRLFGLLGAAFGVGFVAGPALGSVAALGGPRLPFYLAAGIAATNFAVATYRLPETRRTVERSAGRPWRDVTPVVSVSFLALIAFSGFEATFALFGQRRLGLGIASAAAVFSGVGAAIVVVQGGVAHRVVRAVGERPALLGGLIADAGGLVVMASARSWAVAVVALVMLTVGQGLVQTTTVSLIVRRVDPGRRGEALGASQSAGGLARVVGPALGGALLGSRGSGWPYVAGASLCVVAAALAIWTSEKSVTEAG